MAIRLVFGTLANSSAYIINKFFSLFSDLIQDHLVDKELVGKFPTVACSVDISLLIVQ